MIIINNNNNNGGRTPPAHALRQQQVSYPTDIPRSAENIWDLEKLTGSHDRATMIKLARRFGWSGLHFFHFGRPFWGMIHLLLSFIGLSGMISLFYIFIFAENPEGYLYIAMSLIPAFMISVLGGILYSIYWTVHDDETFAAVFPPEKKDAEISGSDIK